MKLMKILAPKLAQSKRLHNWKIPTKILIASFLKRDHSQRSLFTSRGAAKKSPARNLIPTTGWNQGEMKVKAVQNRWLIVWILLQSLIFKSQIFSKNKISNSWANFKNNLTKFNHRLAHLPNSKSLFQKIRKRANMEKIISSFKEH